jgi:hypothetical protein
VYQLTLDDGRTIKATAEHKFIVRLPGHGPTGAQHWRTAQEITDRINRTQRRQGQHGKNENLIWMANHVLPWSEGAWDRDAGFLAGAFDADGTIGQGYRKRWPVLRFAQYDNELLAEVKAALGRKGFSYTQSASRTSVGKWVQALTIVGGKSELLRFLGQMRPPRLLAKWQEFALADRTLQAENWSLIVRAEYVGEEEIVLLSTSSVTYITEAGSSRNTGALDNKFRLNAVVGEVINYYFKAHLHEAQSSESEIHGEVMQNGSFVGPSLLSIEMSRAAASLPSQEFMLFHPRRGKTHHYRIHLAEVDEVRQVEVIGRKS